MANELTIEEAFEVLGMSQTSNTDEIRSAFRELSKQQHPDAPDGSHDQQAKLNRAYETALAYSKGGQLVVVEVKKALQSVERNIARQEAAQEISTFAAATAKHRTRSLQGTKYTAFILAGIVGFLGFITALPGMPPDVIQVMKGSAVGFAGVGAILQFVIQHQNHLVDAFKDRISDETYCIVELRRLGVTANQPFTLDDILERIGLLQAVKLPDPDMLTIKEIIEIKHGIKKPQVQKHFDSIGDPFLWPMLLFMNFMKYDVFRLRPTEIAKMTVLKGVENGILQITSKRPKTYLVASEFKTEFH